MAWMPRQQVRRALVARPAHRSRDAIAMSCMPPNGPASVMAPSAFVASSSAANAAASSVSESASMGTAEAAPSARQR